MGGRGMTRDSMWISIRLHRFELITFALASVAAIAAALWIVASLDALDVTKACLVDVATGAPGPMCDRIQQQFNEIAYGRAGSVLLFLDLLPVIAGLILGASIVGREVERGTTRLAWSLTPARLPWFLERAIPPLVVLIVLSLLVGLAADWMAAAKSPGIDVSAAFVDRGTRGLALLGYAVAAFGLGAGAGAVIGRELPGFVLALVGVVGVVIVISRFDNVVLRAEAVARDSGNGSGSAYQVDLYMDQMFRLPDGSLVSWEQAYPNGQEIDTDGNPVNPLPMVDIIVPGDRYSFVSARTAAEFALVGLGGLVVAGAAATKRGPGS